MKKRNYRRHLSFVAAIALICSFLNWIIETSNHQEIPPNSKQSEFQSNLNDPEIFTGIATVTDGDTVKINNKRIRLLYIDAPETSQKCLDKDGYEYLCGVVATKFLQDLIANQKVICKSAELDIYKRHLGVCYLGKINLNYELVKNGMAIIYNLNEADEELKNLEKQAKTNKVGIWRGPFLDPKEYRKKNKNKKYHEK